MGVKIDPGKIPGSVYLLILASSKRTRTGSNKIAINIIVFPPLPDEIMIDQIPENSSGRENGQRGGDIE